MMIKRFLPLVDWLIANEEDADEKEAKQPSLWRLLVWILDTEKVHPTVEVNIFSFSLINVPPTLSFMVCKVLQALMFVNHYGSFLLMLVASQKTLQCDFDNHLFSGKAAALLQSNGTRIRAAPPYQQIQKWICQKKMAIVDTNDTILFDWSKIT